MDDEKFSQDKFNDIKWKPISLLYVEYPKGDLIGMVLAWMSMLPIFIAVGFITLILFKRDLHTISYFSGILINEGLNWTLKHVIREPRPNRDKAALNTEYGMPSSHTQYMFFFSTYLVFFLFIRVHHNNNLMENLWKYLLSLGSIITAATVGYSRIYLEYHTMNQVLCGSIVGVISGCLWFSVVQCILTPLFPTITSWRISELLMLRDSTLIPNVMWFEYTSHRSEARGRQRKQQGTKLS